MITIVAVIIITLLLLLLLLLLLFPKDDLLRPLLLKNLREIGANVNDIMVRPRAHDFTNPIPLIPYSPLPFLPSSSLS
jgi:hypothetical protein